MTSADARLRSLLAPVEDGIARMRDRLRHDLSVDSPSLSDLIDHIGRFRGKELRGALVLLVAEACGRTCDEHAEIAAIVELIHLATLVHDDVLDGATVRRRVASVNERWDNQRAVLLGDFLYARAFAHSTTLRSRLCSRVLAATTQRICAGEIEQAASRFDFEMSVERYEAIAGAKTAALYAAACDLGARYPERAEGEGRALERFGWELGLAFQIVDDCLDLVGEQELVGKSLGTDVEDGKVSLPVLTTYARADEGTRARMRDAYTLPGLARRVERLRQVCDLAPGVELAQRRAAQLVEGARARILDLEESPARATLLTIGEYVLERAW